MASLGPLKPTAYAETMRTNNAEVMAQQPGFQSGYPYQTSKEPQTFFQPENSAPILAEKENKRTCGLPPKLLWAAVFLAALLIIIAVAVGVGVGIGTKKSTKSSSSPAAPAESATAGPSSLSSLSSTTSPTSTTTSTSTSSSPTVSSSGSLKIVSAIYGASDVTSTAQSVLPNGAYLFLSTSPMPFADPWYGNVKCLALLHLYNNGTTISNNNLDLRTFIACEGTGNYTLVPGPVSLSPSTQSVTNLGPSTSTFHIISVVWGKAEIRDADIYQKLFNCASGNAAVTFSNDFFGQDTWNGTVKSAAIFYTTDNYSTLRSIFGREGQSAYFSTA